MAADRVWVDDDRAVIGFGLRRLRRPRSWARSLDPVQAWARTLTALEGYAGIDFVVELAGHPGGVRGTGRLDVSLLAVGPGEDTARVLALAEDLADLLHVSEELFEFVPLDAAEIATRVTAVEPVDVAEVRRRAERLPGGPHLGFEVGDRPTDPDGDVWALWSFPEDGGGGTREDLALALLSQDGPVSLRFLFRPTSLTDTEVVEVERQTRTLRRAASPIAEPAARALGSILEVRPVFELRVLVASARPLRPACLSSIGFAISPPRHAADRVDVLIGGYDVLHDEVEHDALAGRFRSLRPSAVDGDGTRGGGGGTDAASRLPSLMDPWAVAAACRPPSADDGTFAGLEVAMPALPGTTQPEVAGGMLLGHTPPGTPVTLPHEDRMRHTYVIGQTGTGKSTLLLHMLREDLEAGRGVALIDPHGDLVEAALGLVPDRRRDEVVLLEPTDDEAVVGLNLLEADDEVQREYLVSELCDWMYTLFDPNRQGIVGPRFEQMLRYAALLLMQDEEPWSFVEIPRLFADPAFRDRLLARCRDPLVREFFVNDVKGNRSNETAEVAAWFRSKFEPFRSVRPLRRVLGQTRSTVQLTDLMDRGGILLANLSKGRLGEYNSRLLGFVVFARLWAATMTRAGQPAAGRRDFHLYLDEAQTMTTSSLPSILSEARKYRLSATLANQYFDQIPEDLRASVLGNVGTKVAFRMGSRDATAFAEHYGPEVDAESLRGLPNFEALADILVGGEPRDVQHLVTGQVALPADAAERAAEVRARSRARFARPVDDIDADFDRRYGLERRPKLAEEPTGSSFLDEWLERRKQRAEDVGDDGT